MKVAKEIGMFVVALIILMPALVIGIVLALISCAIDRRYPDHARGA